MTELALFDEPPRTAPPPDEPELTAGERMRRRQAARLAAGLHPLSLQGALRLRLHADAAPPDDRTAPGLRCGGCQHRRMVGGHSRAYPKCVAGVRETDTGTYYPHASMSEATDVRAWWPACVAYQPHDPGPNTGK